VTEAPREVRRQVASACVAVTFDDGPSVFTPAVLDTLNRHEARATFFVIGAAVVSGDGQEAVQRIAASKCEVGNHTFSHPNLEALDTETISSEIARTSLLVEHATGAAPVFFRAPYLRLSESAEEVAREYGLRHVGASVVPADYDWSPEQTAEHVLASTAPGDIVLLHDGWPPAEADAGPRSRAATVAALDLILEGFADRGLRAVTLSELFAASI
jgi:peptidoglycan/xylan/chitin deacetylase (PgdA/CDA1 family)